MAELMNFAHEHLNRPLLALSVRIYTHYHVREPLGELETLAMKQMFAEVRRGRYGDHDHDCSRSDA